MKNCLCLSILDLRDPNPSSPTSTNANHDSTSIFLVPAIARSCVSTSGTKRNQEVNEGQIRTRIFEKLWHFSWRRHQDLTPPVSFQSHKIRLI